MSLTSSAVTTAATVAARPSWAEERRLDRAERARLDRELDDAAVARRIAEREAAQRLRQAADGARAGKRAEAAEARGARLAALGAWVAGHVTGLLFVPVIAVPALLAWTAMASYGAHLYGTPGRALPAFSEGAMWAFAAAVTITRHRYPARPVWHLRAGTVVFAAFGAALNFAHGLTLGGPVTGTVMALVSVAGVTAHQLTTAGPRRPRRTLAERDAAKLARQIRKREMQARTDAVSAATVHLGADGTARLEFPAPEPAKPVETPAAPAAEAVTPAPTPRAPKRSPRPAAEGKQAPHATDTETRINRLRARHPELTGPQIADRLGISARTVRRYPAPQTSA